MAKLTPNQWLRLQAGYFTAEQPEQEQQRTPKANAGSGTQQRVNHRPPSMSDLIRSAAGYQFRGDFRQ